MEKITLTIIFLSAYLFSSSQIEDFLKKETSQEIIKEFDFRKVNWGQSISQVKWSEVEKPWEEDSKEGFLQYRVNVAGFSADLNYYFYNDKLYLATYEFDSYTTSTYRNQAIKYDTIKSKLIKKYREPLYDTIIWHSQQYKNDPFPIDNSLINGLLEYETKWEKPGSSIILVMGGESKFRAPVLIYLSIKYFELKKLWDKKMELNGL